MKPIYYYLCALALAACKGDDKAAVADAQPSASAAAATVTDTPAPAPTPMHEPWWAVAMKGKVAGESVRSSAENSVRLLGANTMRVNAALNGMSHEPATPEGLRAAAEHARDAQATIVDPSFSGSGDSPVVRAIADASMLILAGMVAQACADHPDQASAAALIKAIRELHWPRTASSHTKTPGVEERSWLEQEMSLALDKKTWEAVKASAPPAKKWPD